MNRARQGLKPQDILLLLKLISNQLKDEAQKKSPAKARQIDLALSLHLSQAEVAHSLSRLRKSGFLSSENELRPLAISEFLIHGAKYVFPAQMTGGLGRGVPTASSASDRLKKNLAQKPGSDPPLVWADSKGETRGILLEPLYPSAPLAAKEDAQLHELLALLDVIRLSASGARERKFAIELLKEKISIAMSSKTNGPRNKQSA
jgi:hypothetical protein